MGRGFDYLPGYRQPMSTLPAPPDRTSDMGVMVAPAVPVEWDAPSAVVEPTGQLFRVEQSEQTSDDYLTPRWVFDTLGLEFDLDVASPPWDTHVPAARKYTKADDGLTAEWEGRIWMNPPYSRSAPWVARFILHGNGIALLPMAKSAWMIDLWQSAGGLAVPPRWFDFDGGSIFMPVVFAAFGDECVEAIGRLGRVR